MEFKTDAQRMAVKAAFLRITADQSWAVMRALADEAIYNLEQKSLQEDDEEKARAYRHDARGARKFWEKWLRMIDLAKEADTTSASDNFLEVVM